MVRCENPTQAAVQAKKNNQGGSNSTPQLLPRESTINNTTPHPPQNTSPKSKDRRITSPRSPLKIHTPQNVLKLTQLYNSLEPWHIQDSIIYLFPLFNTKSSTIHHIRIVLSIHFPLSNELPRFTASVTTASSNPLPSFPAYTCPSSYLFIFLKRVFRKALISFNSGGRFKRRTHLLPSANTLAFLFSKVKPNNDRPAPTSLQAHQAQKSKPKRDVVGHPLQFKLSSKHSPSEIQSFWKP